MRNQVRPGCPGVVQWEGQEQQHVGQVGVARASLRMHCLARANHPQKPGKVSQAKVRATRGVLKEIGVPCALQTEKLAVGCKLIMKPEGCRTQTLEDWGRQPTPSTGGCWYAAEVSRHTSTKGGSKSAGKFD